MKCISHIVITGIFFFVSTFSPMDLATTKDPEVVKSAQKHNSTIPLIACPNETSEKIFSYVVDINQPMEKNIKNILAISATCKYFDDSLEWFGELLKPYTAEAKDKIFKKIVYVDTFLRRGTLLMACSGLADIQDSKDVLWDAVRRDDIYMTELLLKNGVSPNIYLPVFSRPVFFGINNPDMATVFAKHKIDFNQKSNSFPNVLWHCFAYKYCNNKLSELIRFYLDHGVNPELLNPNNGQCLLHYVVERLDIKQSTSYVDGIWLLFSVINHQINIIDNKGNTPLDIICKKIKQEGEGWSDCKKKMLLIASQFRLAGAQKAQELKEKEQI
jgi:hypothetical protein